MPAGVRFEERAPVGIGSQGDEPLFWRKPDENEASPRRQSVNVGKTSPTATVPDHKTAGCIPRHRLVFGGMESGGAFPAEGRDVSHGPFADIVARSTA